MPINTSPVQCVNVVVVVKQFTRRDLVYEKNRIAATLGIVAKTETYLHIGRGKDYSLEQLKEKIHNRRIESLDDVIRWVTGIQAQLTSLAVEKLGGKPYIPGTSLKGAARNRIELLLSHSQGRNISCFIVSSPPCRTLFPNDKTWRHIAVWGETVGENRGTCRIPGRIEYLEDVQVCRICDIFGTAGLISRVYFGSLFPKDTGEPLVEVLEARVSLRDRGWSWVEVEAVPPGRLFRGELVVNGLTMDELGLLAIALRLNEDRPILIGRYKYSWLKARVGGVVKTVPFGQLNIGVEEIRFPLHASAFLDSHGYGYERDGASLVLRGNAAGSLIQGAVDAAVEKYRPYLRRYLEGFDEVEEVEKLHKG